jgi:hypothetical protein
MVAWLKELPEILRWLFTWDAVEWAGDKIRNTRWGKAVITALISAVVWLIGWISNHPHVVAGAIGGVSAAFVIFFWDWLGSRKDSYLKPLAPRALEAIDSRIDVEWKKYFGADYQDKKTDLKASIRKFLIFADLVKTHQEYAQERIAEIMADKAHPYHHPEDPNNYMATRQMIKWQRLAELKFKR